MWARHLGTTFLHGTYCSSTACALRSPPASQEVFESYMRYSPGIILLCWTSTSESYYYCCCCCGIVGACSLVYVLIFMLSAFVRACSFNVGHESMILAVYEQVSSRIHGGCIWAFYGVRCSSCAVYSTLVPIHLRNSLRCLFNIDAPWD